VRLNNLHDTNTEKVKIYDKSTKLCTLLNALSGTESVYLSAIKEISLDTVKDKSELKKNPLDPDMPDNNKIQGNVI